MTNARKVSIHQPSIDVLADQKLTFRLIDPNDGGELDGAVQAVARGFLQPEAQGKGLEEQRQVMRARRVLGVFDQTAPNQKVPVGTVASWATPLTIPGGELEMWAISDVTVAATHRRRGIARAMLEGELRAAASAGIPVAGLTVSEATIYRRYGFGAATWVNEWKVDTTRAKWNVAEPAGSLQYLSREELARALEQLHEQTRHLRVGDIAGWAQRWREKAGLAEDTPKAASVRGVAYFDTDGQLAGAMAYSVDDDQSYWPHSPLEVHHMVGANSEARRALWSYLLRHDLIGTVTASMRPVDEPMPWMLSDRRAVTANNRDHGWLRILDMKQALEAREYSAPLSITLNVSDPLEITSGRWSLEITGDEERGYAARVEKLDADAAPTATDDAEITLGISELSSVFLGGVSARELGDADLISGNHELFSRFDRAFHTERAPFLSIWY
jgi:predicted acetyltransferase